MNQEYTIRAMIPDDIDAIAAIEKSVFSDPWPKSAFREFLTSDNRINLVMTHRDQRVIGYVFAQVCADELQVQNIAVLPENRRQGLGQSLLRRAESEGALRGALCSVLDVRATNEAALGLYQGLGYRMIGRRKNYYRRPSDDALVLFRRLDDPNSGSAQETDHGVVP